MTAAKFADWQGKTAVVCGGTSGLGFAIARELVRQRAAQVYLIARNVQQLERSASRLNSLDSGNDSHSSRITHISADVTDFASIQRAAQTIRGTSPAIDLVIQAVGASDRGTIAGLSRQKVIDLVDANVTSSLHAIQLFAPLAKPCQGAIVLIGSLSSFFAPRYLSAYSIAKHGLVALAQQARLELAEDGVHVTLCCPGPIAGDGTNDRFKEMVAASGDLPEEASRPGGGAKVKQLDPQKLARDILNAARKRQILLIRPRFAWWLRLISLISPALGDSILRSRSS